MRRDSDIYKKTTRPKIQEDFLVFRCLKTKRCGSFLRAVSLAVSFIFFFQQAGFAQNESVPVSQAQLAAGHRFDLDRISIPRDIAITKDIGKTEDRKIIINIKDAHDNYAAQRSIMEILENLLVNYDVRLIGIEGSEGYVDTSIISSFPEDKAKELTSDYLMKEGKMSAGECFAALSETPVTLYGIDDSALYLKNYNAFLNLLEFKKENLKYVDILRKALYALEDKIFSSDLKELNRNSVLNGNLKKGFTKRWYLIKSIGEKNGVKQGDYPNIDALTRAIEAEKKIDYDATNAERDEILDLLAKKLEKVQLEDLVLKSLAFKLGRSSKSQFYSYLLRLAKTEKLDSYLYEHLERFCEYVTVYESIDIAMLMDEIDDYECCIKDKIYRNDEERELTGLLKDTEILHNLYSIRLTNGQLRYLMSHMRNFRSGIFIDFIKKQYDKFGLALPSEFGEVIPIFDKLPTAISFYEAATARNRKMVENTIEQMRKSGVTSAAIVTGGFHTRGITDILRSDKVSYLILLPRFNAKKNKRPYVTVLTNKTNEYKSYVDTGNYLAVTSTLGVMMDILRGTGAEDRAFRTKLETVATLMGTAVLESMERGIINPEVWENIKEKYLEKFKDDQKKLMADGKISEPEYLSSLGFMEQILGLMAVKGDARGAKVFLRTDKGNFIFTVKLEKETEEGVVSVRVEAFDNVPDQAIEEVEVRQKKGETAELALKKRFNMLLKELEKQYIEKGKEIPREELTKGVDRIAARIGIKADDDFISKIRGEILSEVKAKGIRITERMSGEEATGLKTATAEQTGKGESKSEEEKQTGEKTHVLTPKDSPAGMEVKDKADLDKTGLKTAEVQKSERRKEKEYEETLKVKAERQNKSVEDSRAEKKKGDFKILAAAYNEEDVIEEAMERALKAGYIDRMVIVDDGSKDSTGEILDRYKKYGLTVIHKQNSGKVDSIRQALIAMEKDGSLPEYVITTDADSFFSLNENREESAKLDTEDPKRVVNKLQEAIDYSRENDLAAVALNIIPTSKEGDGIVPLMQQVKWRYSNSLPKGLSFSVAGAGGVYRAESLVDAMKKHSGKFSAEDTELVALIRGEGGKTGKFGKGLQVKTDIPRNIKTYLKQYKRYGRGVLEQLNPKNLKSFGAVSLGFGSLGFGGKAAFSILPMVGFLDLLLLGGGFLAATAAMTTGAIVNAWRSRDISLSQKLKITLAAPFWPYFETAFMSAGVLLAVTDLASGFLSRLSGKIKLSVLSITGKFRRTDSGFAAKRMGFDEDTGAEARKLRSRESNFASLAATAGKGFDGTGIDGEKYKADVAEASGRKKEDIEIVGADLGLAAAAYQFERNGRLYLVINTGKALREQTEDVLRGTGSDYADVIREVVYHEAREAYWIKALRRNVKFNIFLAGSTYEGWKGLSRDEQIARAAHIMASVETGKRFGKTELSGLTPYHYAEIKSMDEESLEKIKKETVSAREAHHMIMQEAAKQMFPEFELEEALNYEASVMSLAANEYLDRIISRIEKSKTEGMGSEKIADYLKEIRASIEGMKTTSDENVLLGEHLEFLTELILAVEKVLIKYDEAVRGNPTLLKRSEASLRAFGENQNEWTRYFTRFHFDKTRHVIEKLNIDIDVLFVFVTKLKNLVYLRDSFERTGKEKDRIEFEKGRKELENYLKGDVINDLGVFLNALRSYRRSLMALKVLKGKEAEIEESRKKAAEEAKKRDAEDLSNAVKVFSDLYAGAVNDILGDPDRRFTLEEKEQFEQMRERVKTLDISNITEIGNFVFDVYRQMDTGMGFGTERQKTLKKALTDLETVLEEKAGIFFVRYFVNGKISGLSVKAGQRGNREGWATLGGFGYMPLSAIMQDVGIAPGNVEMAAGETVNLSAFKNRLNVIDSMEQRLNDALEEYIETVYGEIDRVKTPGTGDLDENVISDARKQLDRKLEAFNSALGRLVNDINQIGGKERTEHLIEQLRNVGIKNKIDELTKVAEQSLEDRLIEEREIAERRVIAYDDALDRQQSLDSVIGDESMEDKPAGVLSERGFAKRIGGVDIWDKALSLSGEKGKFKETAEAGETLKLSGKNMELYSGVSGIAKDNISVIWGDLSDAAVAYQFMDGERLIIVLNNNTQFRRSVEKQLDGTDFSYNSVLTEAMYHELRERFWMDWAGKNKDKLKLPEGITPERAAHILAGEEQAQKFGKEQLDGFSPYMYFEIASHKRKGEMGWFEDITGESREDHQAVLEAVFEDGSVEKDYDLEEANSRRLGFDLRAQLILEEEKSRAESEAREAREDIRVIAAGSIENYLDRLDLRAEGIESLQGLIKNIMDQAKMPGSGFNQEDAIALIAARLGRGTEIGEFLENMEMMADGALKSFLREVIYEKNLKEENINSVTGLIRYLNDNAEEEGYSAQDIRSLVLSLVVGQEISVLGIRTHLVDMAAEGPLKDYISTLYKNRLKITNMRTVGELIKHLNKNASDQGYSTDEVAILFLSVSMRIGIRGHSAHAPPAGLDSTSGELNVIKSYIKDKLPLDLKAVTSSHIKDLESIPGIIPILSHLSMDENDQNLRKNARRALSALAGLDVDIEKESFDTGAIKKIVEAYYTKDEGQKAEIIMAIAKSSEMENRGKVVRENLDRISDIIEDIRLEQERGLQTAEKIDGINRLRDDIKARIEEIKKIEDEGGKVSKKERSELITVFNGLLENTTGKDLREINIILGRSEKDQDVFQDLLDQKKGDLNDILNEMRWDLRVIAENFYEGERVQDEKVPSNVLSLKMSRAALSRDVNALFGSDVNEGLLRQELGEYSEYISKLIKNDKVGPAGRDVDADFSKDEPVMQELEELLRKESEISERRKITRKKELRKKLRSELDNVTDTLGKTGIDTAKIKAEVDSLYKGDSDKIIMGVINIVRTLIVPEVKELFESSRESGKLVSSKVVSVIESVQQLHKLNEAYYHYLSEKEIKAWGDWINDLSSAWGENLVKSAESKIEDDLENFDASAGRLLKDLENMKMETAAEIAGVADELE